MKPIEADIRRFIQRTGYTPDLNNPKTHSEHVMHKKYYDRNPLLTLTADKIAVREWICCDLKLGKILLSVFYAGYFGTRTPSIKNYIPCVVKANNGSNRNVFVETEQDVKLVNTLLPRWKLPYGQNKGEWCYKDIRPGILIEPMLHDIGESHVIYRFICFDGQPTFVETHEYKLQRIGKKTKPVTISHTMLDMHWQMQKVTIDGRALRIFPPPSTYKEMIDIAAQLSEPFDFVRVDLFEHNGIVTFSELTHYPRSGQYRYNPREFDFTLGRCWE